MISWGDNNMKMILKKRAPFLLDMSINMYYGLKDFSDMLLQRRDPLIPSTRLMFDGPRSIQDFKKNGADFLEYFINLCNLKPDGKVLDVGCGIGRKTLPLTQYLDSNGEYEGFDIIDLGINWCNKNITSKYPNFHFQKADVLNKYYNPNGKYKASEYKFPFEENYFDLVFLGSVFTHMLPNDLENYLSEVFRVLKSDGRCLISYFLINKNSLASIQSNISSINFQYDLEDYRTTDIDIPEDAVSYKESYIRNLYQKHYLEILEPINFGSWSGRDDYLDYQDLIIAKKP